MSSLNARGGASLQSFDARRRAVDSRSRNRGSLGGVEFAKLGYSTLDFDRYDVFFRDSSTANLALAGTYKARSGANPCLDERREAASSRRASRKEMVVRI